MDLAAAPNRAAIAATVASTTASPVAPIIRMGNTHYIDFTVVKIGRWPTDGET